jgi:hypothetical protein
VNPSPRSRTRLTKKKKVLRAPGVSPVPSTATVVPGGAVGWAVDLVDGGICWTVLANSWSKSLASNRHKQR